MDNSESKPNMQDVHEGAYPTKGRVLLASLPRSSIGQKRITGQGRLRGRQVLGPFFFKPG